MTTELFCKSIWNLSYAQVVSSITKKDYMQFKIPKKDGFRTITFLPESSSLYSLQKMFNKFYLMKFNFPVCTKGFVKGENYISYLEPHVGAKYFLRMDIKDFFPSITGDTLKEAFSHLISFDSENDEEEILQLISDICTYNGTLPQGVCTSPMISNIIMAYIDQRITKYCQILDIDYTRYADDMLFSSNIFQFDLKKWFIRKIKFILSDMNLKINYDKLKFGENEISLNGYVVSETGIRLSRGRLMDIKKIISFSRDNYSKSKTEPDNFLLLANQVNLEHRDLTRYPFKNTFQFTQFLIGYRSYLISFLRYDIDPAFRKKAMKLIRNIEHQIDLY